MMLQKVMKITRHGSLQALDDCNHLALGVAHEALLDWLRSGEEREAWITTSLPWRTRSGTSWITRASGLPAATSG